MRTLKTITINVLRILLVTTFWQQSWAQQCRANDLLVYNMALAQLQASSFRQQKPVYIQVPEGVKHQRVRSAHGGIEYLVSVNMFAITNPAPLTPQAFQSRLGKAASNDFVRITFKVNLNTPGRPPCTDIKPLFYEVTPQTTLSWIDIQAKKKQVSRL